MELRQLRYFVRIVELGSMGRAALDLNMVQSALSQQISRLEGELCTRLLQRTAKGAVPTEAGLAFFREAQLALRHADQAARAAQQARLTGTVSVGLSPTTASVLGVPLMRAMHERYPDVRLHMVGSLSGHLSNMLNARQLDIAVLFETSAARRWSMLPLLDELTQDDDPFLLLESTAGQGASLCSRTWDFGPYFEALDAHPKLGVCLDTCHIFAAGHDLTGPAGMNQPLDLLVETVGEGRLKLIHANDSKDVVGAHKDRHENIGSGHIGEEPFRALMNHPATAGVPLVIETPGGKEGHAADVARLKRLRDG